VHLALPVAGSAIVLPRTRDIERICRSSAGRYLRHEMTPQMQAVRLAGDALTVIGAWRHRPAVIVLGGLVVLAGWTFGPSAGPPTV
jgi:hypothetical protein